MLDDVLDATGGRPQHVVGFLFDGCNPNVLHELAARGEARTSPASSTRAPVRARRDGVAAHGHAGQPHRILTGAHPGHHRIINNAWFDKATGEQVITNSPATWAWSMDHLNPAVETIHQAVKRTLAGRVHARRATSCATSAPTCRSSTSCATAGRRRPPGGPRTCRFATERFVRPQKDYQVVVAASTTCRSTQAVGVWGGQLPRPSYPLPRFMWVQLLAHRRGLPRGRAALRDRRGLAARHRRPRWARCSPPSSAPACSTTPRSSSSPTTAWRRTTRRSPATGARPSPPPACRTATRPTASSTPASKAAARADPGCDHRRSPRSSAPTRDRSAHWDTMVRCAAPLFDDEHDLFRDCVPPVRGQGDRPEPRGVGGRRHRARELFTKAGGTGFLGMAVPEELRRRRRRRLPLQPGHRRGDPARRRRRRRPRASRCTTTSACPTSSRYCTDEQKRALAAGHRVGRAHHRDRDDRAGHRLRPRVDDDDARSATATTTSSTARRRSSPTASTPTS